MKHLKFGYPLIGAMTAVAMLAGCADESPWGNTSKEQGSISVSLKTDSGIKTAKPVFRSGEDDETRSTGDPNDLSTYITTLPSVDDFVITLTNSKDQPIKQCTYGEFKEAVKTEKFAADIYTLTASIQGVDPAEVLTDGQKHSTNGFNCYYFEGSTTFTVIPNRETKVDLTAELKKSMVKVNFDQSFIDYVEEGFSAYVHNSNDIKLIPFVNGETKAAFIDPTTAELTTHFTTNVTGKEQTATVKIGDFQAVAKTLHNITLAIDNSKNGFASLTVKFDETVEGNTDVNVNLTDDLYDTSAPEIECTGFANNSYNDISGSIAEGTTYSMTVNAPGGLKTASLTLEGKTIGGKGTFDLLQTDDVTTLTNEGITAKYFTSESPIATLDFTDFVTQLSIDENCTIMLEVSDQKGKTYIYKDPQGTEIQGAKVTFDKKEVLLRRLKEDRTTPCDSDDKIPYASKQAVVYLEYNGDLSDLTFTASDGEPITLKSEVIETRALENKLYKFTLERTFKCKKVTVTANYKGEEVGKKEIDIDVPTYRITQDDAYNNYAYLKVVAEKSTELGTILDNLKIKDNGKDLTIASTGVMEGEPGTGFVTLTGLTPGTDYSVTSSITSDPTGYNEYNTISTESEAGVPNGDFENLGQTPSIDKTIPQGGKWTIVKKSLFTKNPTQYQTTLTMQVYEPTSWVSSNAQTCNLNANNVNSWYCIPSVYNSGIKWVSNQPDCKVGITGQGAYVSTADIYKNLNTQNGSNAMIIRNVAWSSKGDEIPYLEQTGNTDFSNYYCSNKPGVNAEEDGSYFKPSSKPAIIANKTAGFMRLGTATEEGVAFASRPTKLKGFYKYVNDTQDPYEKGVVTVKILKGNATIGSGSIELEAAGEYTPFEVTITYDIAKFKPQATTLKINITSSNRKSEDIKTTDYCNKDECCSRGATLTVDNLTFEYYKP